MGLFDKVSGFAKSEAEDIGEAVERVKDRLEQELTEREAELEMTPSEKLRALQRQARQSDDKIDEIAERVKEEAAAQEAAARTADAASAAAANAAAAADPPPVTQIVLRDGSVRSGDDVPEEPVAVEEVEPEPEAGDLSWIAPGPGEEAIVPAFKGKAMAAAAKAEAEAGEAGKAASGEDLAPPPQASTDTDTDTADELAPTGAFQAATAEPSASADDDAADLAELPPPPAAPSEPIEPAATDAVKNETPAEIAARVVAELESSPAEAVATTPEPAAPVERPRPDPTFEKTPAQRKYEEARRAADALLEELRGELRDEGEI